MTAPKHLPESSILLALAVLAESEDLDVVSARAIAARARMTEEPARIALKRCVERGWAERWKRQARISDVGRARAKRADVAALRTQLAPAAEEEPVSAPRLSSYAERRAAELLGGSFTVEEVAAILKLPVDEVASIRPRKTPQRTEEIVTDAKALRGRHGMATHRTEDDIAGRNRGGSLYGFASEAGRG